MHLKPKKYLGQNFLIDKNIQKKIIAACDFRADDLVVEIGPGTGEFTRLIAPQVKRLYAVELDTDLAAILRRNFRDSANVEIINQDILKFNFTRRFPKNIRRLKIFGNIPYYITTPIIESLLKFRNRIEVIDLTVQKEVGLRITAASGSKTYGALSCFIQYYTQPQILFYIKKGSFFPAPKVDSCLVKLTPRRDALLSPRQEKRFFKLVRAAFNQRRKKLRNSLRGVISEGRLEMFFKTYNHNSAVRPEELGLEDFLNLARA